MIGDCLLATKILNGKEGTMEPDKINSGGQEEHEGEGGRYEKRELKNNMVPYSSTDIR